MAIGSKRRLPTAPCWAAVVSLAMMEPRNTPWSQLVAWVTRGTVVRRRPPNRIAEMGTPAGSSHSDATEGHCDAGAVKRALGWAAGVSTSGVHALPRQSVARAGASSLMPSHHTSPSLVSAVLVKIELPHRVSIALALVS